MKRFKRISVLCAAAGIISAGVGVYCAIRDRRLDEAFGVAIFYTVVWFAFAVIARVVERATPPK